MMLLTYKLMSKKHVYMQIIQYRCYLYVRTISHFIYPTYLIFLPVLSLCLFLYLQQEPQAYPLIVLCNFLLKFYDFSTLKFLLFNNFCCFAFCIFNSAFSFFNFDISCSSIPIRFSIAMSRIFLLLSTIPA